VLVATVFGSGFSPAAPGTVGSLIALPLWWFLLGPLDPLWRTVAIVASCAAGILIVDRVCRLKGVDDDRAIVLDEVLGMAVTLWVAPRNVAIAVLGFLLFRGFDILKPWPVSWAERKLPGGLGVVADDLLAGVLAACVLEISLAMARQWGVSFGA
jgi:phosphatidylglycerophosphatase A